MQPTDSQVTDQTVTPARTLRAAAYYLAQHGWIQGSYYDGSATVFTPAACLVGAISMVCYGGPVEAPAQHFDTPEWADFEAAVAFLDEHLVRVYGMDVYTYNDACGRSVSDVLADLHTAANTWDHRQFVVEVAG